MPDKSQLSSFDEQLSAIIGLVIGLLFIGGGFWVRHIETHEWAMLNETQGTVVVSATTPTSRRE